eukprot:jgi/Tetstr1/428345/TSEL_018380.t1
MPMDAAALAAAKGDAGEGCASGACGPAVGGSEQENKRARTASPPRDEGGAPPDGALPDVSVLMPCRNAMPWLPDCVASILAQDGVSVELLAVDDGSTDGSHAWLLECEAACRACPPLSTPSGAQADGGSVAQADGGAGEETHEAQEGGGRLGWVAERYSPPSVAAVAAQRRPGNSTHVGEGRASGDGGCQCKQRREMLESRQPVSLRVFSVKATGPSGQGLALNTAMRHARAPLIGEMESDDLRPPRTFATLAAELAAHPHLDAVASQVKLVGWPREGMERYIQWQNDQLTEQEMAGSRFVEIPALRASALYRRECMLRLRGYRDLWETDGVVTDYATSAEHDAFLRAEAGGAELQRAPEPWAALAGWWPVDSDFWMRFFAAGMQCRKVPLPLYEWRQYPAQSTRTHSRCSIAQLRSCKIHFATCPCSPLHGRSVQVWSIGTTLADWGEGLRAAGIQEVELVTYKPGAPLTGITAAVPPPEGVVRVFVYGAEKARAKVRKQKAVRYDAARDWFAA